MPDFTRSRRDQVIDRAIAEGKFAESRRPHYQQLYDASPQDTERFIDSLTGVLNARGVSAAAPVERYRPDPAAPGADEYPEAWLSPPEQARLAAAREGRQHARIVNEQ